MSAVKNALVKSRMSYDMAYDYGMQIKAKRGGQTDISDILTPLGYGGAFSQLSGTDQSRYALFRGWVHSAINAIATEGAGQPVMLGKMSSKANGKPTGQKAWRNKMTSHAASKAASTEVEIIQDHPLQDVLDRPNSIQHKWQFVYSFITNLCLTGWGYIIGERSKERGFEFYSVPSSWMIPDHTKGPFAEFRIVNPSNPKTYQGEPLDRSQVTFAYIPDPSNPLSALALAQAQGKAFKIDSNIQTSQERFFENGMFPSVIITMGNNVDGLGQTGSRPLLTAAQRRQVTGTILKNWSGVTNYGDPAIIDGLIEKIDRWSMDSTEMGWDKSEDKIRARILSAFCVHPYILGEREAGSYAQANNIEKRFYKRVNSFLDLLGTVMTDFVHQMGDDVEDLLIWWEECQSTDPSIEAATWKDARSRGDVSQNEFREWMGLPPDEDTNESHINSQAISHVISVAAQCAAGKISPDQAETILVGLGLPDKLARQIAGDGPPEEPEPEPEPDAELQGAQEQLQGALAEMEAAKSQLVMPEGYFAEKVFCPTVSGS